ncbi:MAG TPA: excinuclease ABC subunit UvrA [Dissulfurispiraceae bacterium]|nr:excinuclease ABC subunit UvrA [Dissulfurispiraceae bacterium]
MSVRDLIIEGAKQNNLRNVSLTLPHDKVIVITGLSGSGKSSLAFDTIFAEGQWRFIESLSAYARLFLEKLDRPDVDAIHNIRPAIALEQKNPVKGARSTVGTLTELYDLLRVLFARVATPFCPVCGKEIRRWDPSQIVADLIENHQDQKALIVFSTNESPVSLKQRGFHRMLVNGEIREIDEMQGDRACHQTYEVVLDRLVIRDDPRLSDSIEMAWREGGEQMKVMLVGEDPAGALTLSPLSFSSLNACDDCHISLPEPTPILFSFNHPLCACPECKGFGNILKYDEEIIVPDQDRSLNKGAIDIWEKPGYSWWKEQMLKGARKAGIDLNTPYRHLGAEAQKRIFTETESFYGIKAFFDEMETKRYKLHVRVFLSRYRTPITCPLCLGKRLCTLALAYKINGYDIADVCEMPIDTLASWIEGLHLTPMQRDIAKEAMKQLLLKLHFLKRVGLGYLTLSRQAKTLSGGEYQRVNLANQLASALTGTLYVLDEPTIGLHPLDTDRIIAIIRELSNLGNTILVVEHDRDVIRSADWVVELGPGGGHRGGEIVFSGPMQAFLASDTITANYVRGARDGSACFQTNGKKSAPLRAHQSSLVLKGATGHNLKNLTLRIPVGLFTVVTGVSGSGKSSLIIETLCHALGRHFKTDSENPLPHESLEGAERLRGVQFIDQSPIGKTPRSNPLTYLKIFEPIRKLFAAQPEAKAHGYTPGFFSFNVPGGRCETCKGEGYERLELFFFEDVYVKCEDCKGLRYRDEALRVAYNGKNVSQVLDMTVDEAGVFFAETSDVVSRLRLLQEIGLGYLRLGQPATTLSGGEAQRLKICAELAEHASRRSAKGSAKGMLYLLDEPTVGLHHNDVILFMGIIRKLIENGNTVVIIEHNLDVICQADWAVDLGPEGGERGGMILFEGPAGELAHCESSATGRYLTEYQKEYAAEC